MSDGLDRLAANVAELGRQKVRPRSHDWERMVQTARELVSAAITAYGVDATARALGALKGDPRVATVLAAISEGRDEGGGHLRITDVFTDAEIVTAALSYLEGMSEDGSWAWTVVWNLSGELEATAHARLLARLIERFPWDDQMLWMIGDGPLSELATSPGDMARLESLETIQGKLVRIRRLLEADWPRGSAVP